MRRVCLFLAMVLMMAEVTLPALAEESIPDVVIGENHIDKADMQYISGGLYVSVESYFIAADGIYALSQNGKKMQIAGNIKPHTIFAISAVKGKNYVNVNGRYIYIKSGVKFKGDKCYLPLSVLLCATGASKNVTEEAGPQTYTTGLRSMTTGSDFYDEELVYWMSKTINSEAGNQSLEGKIAVGNVIINRMRSSRYSNTVTGVIFQKGQFDGTLTAAFKATPPEECVIAAKIAIEGIQIYHNAMYFNRAGMNSWARSSRPFLGTLGGHDFFA